MVVRWVSIKADMKACPTVVAMVAKKVAWWAALKVD
jgi:hypothetical protein